MRLPWPFNKAQRAAAARADSTDVSSVRPKGPQAWRDLPALQRSVGEPPLIAPTPPFRDELAGAAPAPIALAPLSHGRGLEAPAGIAHNIVTAVAAVSGKELAPLRRRPSAVAISSLEDAPEQRADVQHRDASPATSPHTVATVSGATKAVARPSAERASFVKADRQLFLPSTPVGLVGASRAAAAVQRAPVKPEAPAPRPATDTSKVASVVPASAPLESHPERLTLGQSRRRGLGAPIEATVAQPGRNVASSERAFSTPSQPVDSSSELPVARPNEAVLQALPLPALNDALPASRLEPAPVVPSAAAAPARRSAEAAAALAPPIHQRSPRASKAGASAVSPLVGARPLSAAVQRAPSVSQAAPSNPEASSAQPSPASSGTQPVRVHRGSAANELAGTLDARAFTQAGEIYLPDTHGPLSGQKAQSLLAHEMTHVVQQRRFGSNLPDESTPHGQRLEAEAASAETHEMPLALTSSPPAATTTATVATPAQSAPARAFDLQAPHRDKGTQRAPSANDAKFSDPDDEFRDKLRSNEDELFATFERRLRHALLHERERGGTLIDAL